MGTLRGDGFSLVPRESRAALQVLWAIEQAEQDEIAQQFVDAQELHQEEGLGHGEGEEFADDLDDGQREGEEDAEDAEAEEAGDVVPLPDWVPSAELIARQPPLLRIPFELEGAWVQSTGELVLTKRHVQGVHHEIVYEGTITRHDGPVCTFTLQMGCDYAAATLSLTCEEAEAQDQPQQHAEDAAAHAPVVVGRRALRTPPRRMQAVSDGQPGAAAGAAADAGVDIALPAAPPAAVAAGRLASRAEGEVGADSEDDDAEYSESDNSDSDFESVSIAAVADAHAAQRQAAAAAACYDVKVVAVPAGSHALRLSGGDAAAVSDHKSASPPPPGEPIDERKSEQ